MIELAFGQATVADLDPDLLALASRVKNPIGFTQDQHRIAAAIRYLEQLERDSPQGTGPLSTSRQIVHDMLNILRPGVA